MPHRWLTFLTISVLSVLVFIFFGLRLRPVEIPKLETTDLSGTATQPTTTFVNPSLGPDDAALTIVLFSDFQCDACQQISSTLGAIVKAYPEDVRLVWKDMPNESLHTLATPAAIAAHCADRQEKFWEYHDELFAKQVFLSESLFTQIASTIGLDVDTFQSCYDNRDTLPIITKDFEEGQALGITSTPTLYVGEEILIGAIDLTQLMTVVQNQISAR
jgi:protein-disulfide isomerase